MIIGISGKIGSGKSTVGRIIQYLTCGYYNTIYFYSEWIDRVENYGSDTYSNWQIKSYAGKLKDCVSIITNISKKDLNKEEIKNSNLPKEWNKRKISVDLHGIEYISDTATPITVRILLQEFGTEVCRKIHSDFWVNALFSDYIHLATNWDCDGNETCGYEPAWIIDDVRFPNELKAIKDRNGITIRLNRNTTDIDFGNGIRGGRFPDIHSSETALDNATFDYTIDNNDTIEELIKKVKEILIKEKII